MSDEELESIYKGAIGVSRFAAMHAIYDAGYAAGLAAATAVPAPEPVREEPAPTYKSPSLSEAAAISSSSAAFFTRPWLDK